MNATNTLHPAEYAVAVASSPVLGAVYERWVRPEAAITT